MVTKESGGNQRLATGRRPCYKAIGIRTDRSKETPNNCFRSS